MTQHATDKFKTTHETRTLKCQLTDDEIKQATEELTQSLDSLEVLEDDKKKMASDYKAQIEAKEAMIRVLKNRVRDKYEMRPVRCTMTLNYTQQTVSVIREDTQEVVKNRQMNEDEKQMEMGFDDMKD